MTARRRHRTAGPKVHELVRDQVALMPGADVIDIARTVAMRAPEAHLRELLASAVCSKVKKAFALRLARFMGVEDVPATGPPDHPAEALHYPVSVGAGEWRPLGQCTAEHVRGMADFRLSVAGRHLTVARRYHELAEALDAAHGQRVADLPLADVARLLQGAPPLSQSATAEGART